MNIQRISEILNSIHDVKKRWWVPIALFLASLVFPSVRAGLAENMRFLASWLEAPQTLLGQWILYLLGLTMLVGVAVVSSRRQKLAEHQYFCDILKRIDKPNDLVRLIVLRNELERARGHIRGAEEIFALLESRLAEITANPYPIWTLNEYPGSLREMERQCLNLLNEAATRIRNDRLNLQMRSPEPIDRLDGPMPTFFPQDNGVYLSEHRRNLNELRETAAQLTQELDRQFYNAGVKFEDQLYEGEQ